MGDDLPLEFHGRSGVNIPQDDAASFDCHLCGKPITDDAFCFLGPGAIEAHNACYDERAFPERGLLRALEVAAENLEEWLDQSGTKVPDEVMEPLRDALMECVRLRLASILKAEGR